METSYENVPAENKISKQKSGIEQDEIQTKKGKSTKKRTA